MKKFTYVHPSFEKEEIISNLYNTTLTKIVCYRFEEYLEAQKKFVDSLLKNEENKKDSIDRFHNFSSFENDYGPSIIYEYNLLTLDELKLFIEKNENEKNASEIAKEIINNLNKKYKNGYLIGFQITEEDYYYVLFNKNKNKIEYFTCVGKLE